MELTAITFASFPQAPAVERNKSAPAKPAEESVTRPEAQAAALAEQQAQAAESRRRARVEQAAQADSTFEPHYKFEYEGKHPILKLQDSKGDLIYQIPSKGRLEVLQDEERSATRLEDTA